MAGAGVIGVHSSDCRLSGSENEALTSISVSVYS